MNSLLGLHEILATAASHALVIEKITVDSDTFSRLASEVSQMTVYGDPMAGLPEEFKVANFSDGYVTIKRGK